MYTPFQSPMAIATFEPIVALLRAYGVVHKGTGDYDVLDVAKYLELAKAGTRWDQLPGNTACPARKNVLVTTTDPRESNSAAMYLSIVSLVVNGNAVVSAPDQEAKVLPSVTMLPFSTTPGTPRTFTVPEQNPDGELGRIKAFAEGLTARGGTAIHDSLSEAYRVLEPSAAKDPDRFTSIVLMTDGENANGSSLADFLASSGSLPSAMKQVPVFTVLFGEGVPDASVYCGHCGTHRRSAAGSAGAVRPAFDGSRATAGRRPPGADGSAAVAGNVPEPPVVVRGQAGRGGRGIGGTTGFARG